jgi:multidrug resistance protein
MNPRNMHPARKWLVTFTMAFCSMCVTCTSSLYTLTYTQMNKEFGSSRIVATLGLSLFVFGLGLSPMVLGPLSEFYGRRPIYIGAFVFFTIWLVPCAVAPNIQTMLIARFFDGLSGSAFLSVAGGTVGDMFARQKLQAPMMVYTASPFIGPGLGPIVGGFINEYLNWRWSFWILLIWSGIMLVAIFFLIPETYHPVVSLPASARLHRELTFGSSCETKPADCVKRQVTKSTRRQLRLWTAPFVGQSLDHFTGHFCCSFWIQCASISAFSHHFCLAFSTSSLEPSTSSSQRSTSSNCIRLGCHSLACLPECFLLSRQTLFGSTITHGLCIKTRTHRSRSIDYRLQSLVLYSLLSVYFGLHGQFLHPFTGLCQ